MKTGFLTTNFEVPKNIQWTDTVSSEFQFIQITNPIKQKDEKPWLTLLAWTTFIKFVGQPAFRIYTTLSVAKILGKFKYNNRHSSFEAYLLHVGSNSILFV